MRLTDKKPLLDLKGVADAVEISQGSITFVLTHWTSDRPTPPLPDSIPTTIFSWRGSPPFQGRDVEVLGTMGTKWNKEYLHARTVRIPSLGYIIKAANFSAIIAVAAFSLFAGGAVFLYYRFHPKPVPPPASVTSEAVKRQLYALVNKDLYLCHGATLNQPQGVVTAPPQMTPLKIVKVDEVKGERFELTLQLPGTAIATLNVIERVFPSGNEPHPAVDSTRELDALLNAAYAFTAVPAAWSADEVAHIQQGLPAIGMSSSGVSCAMGPPHTDKPFYTGGDLELRYGDPPTSVFYNDDSRVTAAIQLTLSIKAIKSTYSRGESIALDVSLLNLGPDSTQAVLPLGSTVHVSVFDSRNKLLKPCGEILDFNETTIPPEKSLIPLGKDRAVNSKFQLSCHKVEGFLEGIKFDSPGKYRIEAFYVGPQQRNSQDSVHIIQATTDAVPVSIEVE